MKEVMKAKDFEVDDKPICIIEVNENLRRVKLGIELTRSLKQLKTNCDFEKKYNEWCNINDGLDIDTDIEKVEKRNKYNEEYRRRPEAKEYRHKYYLKNKKRYKEYFKKYRKKPEVIAHRKEYYKEYNKRKGIRNEN